MRRVLTVFLALVVSSGIVLYIASAKLYSSPTPSIHADSFKNLLQGDRFKTYLLTTGCERETDHITSWMGKGTFMLDNNTEVAPKCKSYSKWDYQQIPPPADYAEDLPMPRQKFKGPETAKERATLKKDPDHKFRTTEFQKWMETVETRYRHKYGETLRACSKGKHELCILLEDDIVFINDRDLMLYRLGLHTLPEHSGPEVSWDCAKEGSGWSRTKIDGNKSQCRIVHRDYAGCLADFFEITGYPADLALADGMAHCKMVQKRFLLVQHTGRKSLMAHDQ